MRARRLTVNGRPAEVRVRDGHLVVGSERYALEAGPIDVERAPRDYRLLVLGVSLFMVGGFLSGLLWSGGWFPRFLASAIPWSGVVLSLVGVVAAVRQRATLRLGALRIEGPARRVERLAEALKRLRWMRRA